MKPTTMNKKDKVFVGGSSAASLTGTAVALGGKSALWAIYSAGPGAALTGAAELNGFLAWCGFGSLASGGGGMALGSAILSALGPVGIAIAGAGAISAGVAIYKNRKRNKKEVSK